MRQKKEAYLRRLLEFGPLIWVVISLWIKQIYFSTYLQGYWYEESLSEWFLNHAEIFAATLASVLMLVFLTPLISRTKRLIALIIINLLLTTIILADGISIRFYGDVISVVNFTSVSMMKAVAPSVYQKLQLSDIIYYLDIIVAAILIPFYLRACKKTAPTEKRFMRRTSAALFVATCLLFFSVFSFIFGDGEGAFTFRNVQREICAAIGVIPYHIRDFVMHISSSHRSIGEADQQNVADFLKEREVQAPPPSKLFGIARDKNLILISAESLQAFPIDIELDGQPVMPNLTAFAKQSLNFVNFYDQTYLGTTSDGEFVSLNSLHPLPVGYVVTLSSTNKYNGLPSILASHGYQTISACGAASHFWNMDIAHPAYGFQRSYYEDSYPEGEFISYWLADEDFFRQTVPIMQSQPRPFMSFMLSSSNHHPFEMPEHHQTLKLGKLKGTLLGNYLQSVHYFDYSFGKFIDGLRDSGLLDETVIALYGDHQGFMGETPELAELLKFPKTSQLDYFQTKKRVAFIVRLPKGEGAQVMTVPGGHLDIAPTLLALLGITDKQSVLIGKDLTRLEDNLVVFRDGGFMDKEHVFIKGFGAVSSSTCYDKATGEKIDCNSLDDKRRQAMRQLDMSDMIIEGNLVQPLMSKRKEQTAANRAQ